MRFLFLFVDGVGLGDEDTQSNPFARADLPALHGLLDGRRLLAKNAPFENERASLLALDACLGVAGLPQSATGQAALLTGENIPAALGYHYGPKPNPEVAALIEKGNIFSRLRQNGLHPAFINAYPPGYFAAIDSGRRLYAAIPLAAAGAGLPLMTVEELRAGQALSADFTGRGWRSHLGFSDTPVLTPFEAGQQLARLAAEYDFTFFEYWLSDYAGHKREMQAACDLLGEFDRVLAGLLSAWPPQSGLILLTSDHGNLEDLSTRRHTANPVPALLFGDRSARRDFAADLHDLTGVAPAIQRFLNDLDRP